MGLDGTDNRQAAPVARRCPNPPSGAPEPGRAQRLEGEAGAVAASAAPGCTSADQPKRPQRTKRGPRLGATGQAPAAPLAHRSRGAQKGKRKGGGGPGRVKARAGRRNLLTAGGPAVNDARGRGSGGTSQRPPVQDLQRRRNDARRRRSERVRRAEPTTRRWSGPVQEGIATLRRRRARARPRLRWRVASREKSATAREPRQRPAPTPVQPGPVKDHLASAAARAG